MGDPSVFRLAPLAILFLAAPPAAQTYTRWVATYGSPTNLPKRPASNPYVASDNVFTLSATGFASPGWWGVVVDNESVDVMFGAVPVPEPSAVLGLAAAGLGVLTLWRRPGVRGRIHNRSRGG